MSILEKIFKKRNEKMESNNYADSVVKNQMDNKIEISKYRKQLKRKADIEYDRIVKELLGGDYEEYKKEQNDSLINDLDDKNFIFDSLPDPKDVHTQWTKMKSFVNWCKCYGIIHHKYNTLEIEFVNYNRLRELKAKDIKVFLERGIEAFHNRPDFNTFINKIQGNIEMNWVDYIFGNEDLRSKFSSFDISVNQSMIKYIAYPHTISILYDIYDDSRKLGRMIANNNIKLLNAIPSEYIDDYLVTYIFENFKTISLNLDYNSYFPYKYPQHCIMDNILKLNVNLEKCIKTAGSFDIYFLEYIPNEYYKYIDMNILKYYPEAIKYIKNPSEEYQLEVIKQNTLNIKYINKPTPLVYRKCITKDPCSIKFIPKDKLNKQMYNLAITLNPWAIKYIDDPTEEMCFKALKGDIRTERYIIYLNDKCKRYLKTNKR